MSTMEIELNNMNNTSDGSPIVTGDENEQKSITGLDELLEQELKEDDSVDCFIKRVGDASEDSSEFDLNYDEAPVVSSSAFYSPKEETSTDNNSLLEKEFEITLSKGKEIPFTSDADKFQSGEEETNDEIPVTNTSVEATDESRKEIKEKGVEESRKEIKEKGEEENTKEIKEKGEEESTKEINEKEEEKSTEEINEKGEDESTKESKEKGEDESTKESKEKGEDESTKEIKEKGVDDMLNKNGLDSVQNQGGEHIMITQGTDSEVKDQINKEHSVVEDTTKERETDEVHDSIEVKLPSEMPNSDTEQTEKDNNNQNVKAENTTEVCKNVLYLVFHPNDQVNKKNYGGKDIPSKKTVQCSENSTSSASVTTSHTSPDKPVTKTVLNIAGSSEAKNGKEINKSIIVKKITAKIIKNANAGTTKPANECEVNDHTSGEDSQSSTKSSEPEEKQLNKPDDTKEEPEKAVHNDDAANVKILKPKIILTKKVYGNSKKSQKVLQEKQVSNTEDGEAPNMDTQDHHSNTLGNGVKLPVKTKVLVSNEGKILPGKPNISGKKGGECIEKRTNFGVVKRKFEEICRISREEEDAAIEEIKKMKKETLDVLEKINAEMEKLKLVFLAGK